MLDDFGQEPQWHVGIDRAASLGEQRPRLTDGSRDGRAVHAKPAGQHVASASMTKMDEACQQAVDEHQLVFRSVTMRLTSRNNEVPLQH